MARASPSPLMPSTSQIFACGEGVVATWPDQYGKCSRGGNELETMVHVKKNTTINYGGSLLRLFQKWRPNTFADRQHIRVQIGNRAVTLTPARFSGEKSDVNSAPC